MADWEEILSRDGPVVWRTAYRLLGNRADAEECFQETFLAALKLSRREELREPRAILMRLATARAMDRLRRRYRHRAREQAVEWDELQTVDASPQQGAQTAELSDHLRTALTALPARQAQAFCLFHLEGWNYQQIADHLRITADNVGVMLHRARARLRTQLSPSFTAET